MLTGGILGNKWFYWPLFLGLFAYAIYRAWNIEPILDELATFYTYIRTGNYFNSIEIIDANNHVANSFLGHQFYSVFGDHFFLFRLGSLCAFPVYFFSLKFIVNKAIPNYFNVLVFIALISVPWIFEYFSYSRGYSMAIAFFFASIAFIVQWRDSKRLGYFLLIFVCLYVMIASSLTYLMPSILVFGIVCLLLLLPEFRSRKSLIAGCITVLVWILAIIPFVRYSFDLREAGALWWGNQDGLWLSTGKSLSRLVLFSDSFWIFYVVCMILLMGTIIFFKSWKEKGIWQYLKEVDAILFLLLFGVLTGFFVMRHLFDINYPMDRVGMYVVPLFLLYAGVFLSKSRYTKYFLITFIFFPISFAITLNGTTSIFSPEDRIPEYFVDNIRSEVSGQTSLSAEHVPHMSYAFARRNDKIVHMAYTAEMSDEFLGDFHINWLGRDSIKGYTILQRDPESHTTFFGREQMQEKCLLLDTIVKNQSSNNSKIHLLKKELDSKLRPTTLKMEISGKISLNEKTTSFNIVRCSENASGEGTSYSSPPFNWYFGERKEIEFTFVDRPFLISETDRTINVFFLNGDFREVKVDFVRIRVYGIN